MCVGVVVVLESNLGFIPQVLSTLFFEVWSFTGACLISLDMLPSVPLLLLLQNWDYKCQTSPPTELHMGSRD